MSSAPNQTQRILTGDTPTGKLHLGHWVGSVKRRVELQSSHDCFFILANMHAFTTRADQPEAIREDTLEIVRDLLCMGIDPEGASIFLQSEIPAIAELTFLFSMLPSETSCGCDEESRIGEKCGRRAVLGGNWWLRWGQRAARNDDWR